MRPHDALMERLAAADPVRDEEPLTPEEQREADALLARLLATPVAEPRRARSRLRRAPVVALAACAVLAAIVAIKLVGSDTAGPGVVDRAVAATTRGGVYHVVELTTAGRVQLRFESWHTRDGQLHRKAFSDGRLVEDLAGRRRAGAAAGSALTWDAGSNTISEGGFADGGGVPALGPFADPGSQLRALEEQGRLREAGATTVDGRRAYRLVADAASDDEPAVEITVDAETYLPLSQRLTYDKLEALTRYRVYERLALDDDTARLLALDPHPGAKCSELAHELSARDLGFPNPCSR